MLPAKRRAENAARAVQQAATVAAIKKYTTKKFILFALTLLLLSACASRRSVQVLDLPPRPAPVAPQAALKPIPPAGYFLTRLSEIFRP